MTIDDEMSTGDFAYLLFAAAAISSFGPRNLVPEAVARQAVDIAEATIKEMEKRNGFQSTSTDSSARNKAPANQEQVS